MAIVRSYPRRPAPRTDIDDFNALVNRFFSPSLSGSATAGEWSPSVNVKETPEGLVLSAELPGMKPEDVEIEFENNVLSIRGEKESETTEEEGERYHVWERRYGSFHRSFTLPRTIDSSAIQASFDNGILTVSLPKAAEAKSRRIEVNTAKA